MMWKPNSVRTTSEIAPGLKRNATSSNSLTITPRRNQPRAPPCSRETLSAEYFFATSANPAPPPWRSATTRESASCSALALAAESGFGTITIWRNEIAAGRLACCARFASQNARISASDGGIGRSFPFCFSPSINRCCRIARRCWSASQRRHSSSDTNPAARSCVWNSGIEVNCFRTFWTVCSTWSCTSWSVTLMVVSRSACWTRSSSSTICRRTWRRAAPRPAESVGIFIPCACASTSCSSTWDARIGLEPTIATMRSTGRAEASSPWPAPGRATPAARPSPSSGMARTRISARHLLFRRVQRRRRRRARRGLQPGPGATRGRIELRPDPLGALQRLRQSRRAHGPPLPRPQPQGEERRHRKELRRFLHERPIEVVVHVSHRDVRARRLGGRGVLQGPGRQRELVPKHRQHGVVLGLEPPPVLGRQRHACRVDFPEQQLPLRQLADELRELGIARHADIQLAGVERVEPAGQVAHPESAAAVAGELPVVVGRRADVLDRLAHQRRGTTPHF